MKDVHGYILPDCPRPFLNVCVELIISVGVRPVAPWSEDIAFEHGRGSELLDQLQACKNVASQQYIRISRDLPSILRSPCNIDHRSNIVERKLVSITGLSNGFFEARVTVPRELGVRSTDPMTM